MNGHPKPPINGKLFSGADQNLRLPLACMCSKGRGVGGWG